MHKRPIEIFTSLDLEMNQPSGKIIQIGSVVGSIATGEILESLSIFVNPQEDLTPYIVNLTKITQEDVDNGMTLEDAYHELRKMHERHGSFVNPITWGGGDSQELLIQLKEENPDFAGWCFGRRWIDAKTIFVSSRIADGQQIQGGLKSSCKKMGIKLSDQCRWHRADFDALYTFKIYCKLLELLKTDPKK